MRKKGKKVITVKRHYFKSNIDFLIESKSSFTSTRTMKTDSIIYGLRKMFFCDVPYAKSELGLLLSIKKDVTKSALYRHFFINLKKEDNYKLYALRKEIQYNYLYKSACKRIIRTGSLDMLIYDLNNAYTSICFFLGLISKKNFDRLISLKNSYKKRNVKNKNINFLLGAAFMTSKIERTYVNGKAVAERFIENETDCLWLLITFFCDVLLRECCRDITVGGERIAFAYFVDGIFLSNPKDMPSDFLDELFADTMQNSFKKVVLHLNDRFHLSEALGNIDNEIPKNIFYKVLTGKILNIAPENNFLKIETHEKGEQPFFFGNRSCEKNFD